MRRHWKLLVATLAVVSIGVVALFAATRARSLADESSLARDELIGGVDILKQDGPSLTRERAQVATGDFVAADRHFSDVGRLLESNQLVRVLANLPGLHQQLEAGAHLAGVGVHLSRAGKIATGDLLAVAQRGRRLPQLSPTERVLSAFDAVSPTLPEVQSELVAVRDERNKIPSQWLVPPLASAVRQFDSKLRLAEVEALVVNLRQAEQALRSFFGGSGTRSYLVLQQDPAELRPTGGFIGSVGFVTFSQGKMGPFLPINSYDLDVRNGVSVLGPPGSSSHVELPTPIHEAFPLVTSWSLRDSNWSPDFPTAARQAEFFLERETGRHVDGVIAIDPYLIQNLLAVLGPVEVPETGDIVNQSNFFLTTIKRVELNQSGSGKSFLSYASRAIFDRLVAAAPSRWYPLIQAIQSGCATRSIQAYFHDLQLENFAVGPCGGQVPMAIGDGLMVIEANLGANKDDFWLKRSYSLEIRMNADGTARHTLRLHYYDLTRQDVRLTEYLPYAGWLRVYLPPSSAIVSVTGASLTGATDLGRKRVVQGWFNVPFNAVTDLEIVYDVSANEMDVHGGRLRFAWRKQAGRPADAIAIKFTPPPGRSLRAIHVGMDSHLGPLRTNLSVDREFVFDY